MNDPIYQLSSDVVWRESTADVIVLPRGTREVVRLSGSGVALWEALQTPATLGGLAEVLALRFSVSTDEVLRDIAPVLDDLVRRGVVDRIEVTDVERSA